MESNEAVVIDGETGNIKKENIVKRFFHRHETFFTYVYGAAFVIGYIWAGINLLKTIFDSIRNGDFITFVISIVFSSIIMIVQGLLFGLIFGTILMLILFLPYLVIRGLRN